MKWPEQTLISPLFRLFATSFLFLSFIHSGVSHAQENNQPSTTVTADSIRHDRRSGVTEAEGSVHIERGDLVLEGDRGTLDSVNGKGTVEGNVRIKMPSAEVNAARMNVDMKTGFGSMENASGKIQDQLNFTAKKLERKSERSFLIEEGTLTSCSPENPDWLFETGSATVQVEGFAILRNAMFRFHDMPVFYTPIWAVPAVTKRTSGLLIPSFGHSSRDGTFLNNSFFWARSEQDDATLSLDYLEKRGTREGLQYRYAFAERTRGEMNLNYINDRKLSEEIWRVRYDHRQQLTEMLDSRARLDFESDTSYSKEFSDGLLLSTRRYTDSYLHLNGNLPATYFSILARDQKSLETSRKETFSRLPELHVSRLPTAVMSTPLLLEGEVTATSFKSDIRGVSSPLDSKINRLDFRPMASLPFPMFDMLNITPWAAGRLTHYSGNTEDNSSLTTEYYNTGISIEGPRFFRVFNGNESTYKHSLTPRLEYSYTPGYDIDGRDRMRAYTFDMLDDSSPQNLLTLSLINRVFRRDDGGETGEIARLNLVQSYDFNEANRKSDGEKRPFSNLFADLNSRPFEWLILNADISYNHYLHEPDSHTQELGLKLFDRYYVSYDRSYNRSPLTTFSTGLFGLDIYNGVTAEVSTVYDEVNMETNGSIFSLSYNSCCWGITFTYSVLKRVEQLAAEDVRRETETRFFFNISLKGMGDLGEKPTHLIGRKL